MADKYSRRLGNEIDEEKAVLLLPIEQLRGTVGQKEGWEDGETRERVTPRDLYRGWKTGSFLELERSTNLRRRGISMGRQVEHGKEKIYLHTSDSKTAMTETAHPQRSLCHFSRRRVQRFIPP
jgi:hypothetical protein